MNKTHYHHLLVYSNGGSLNSHVYLRSVFLLYVVLKLSSVVLVDRQHGHYLGTC